MSTKHRLPREAQREAARRVLTEDPRPLAEFRTATGVTVETLRSWIIDGRGGVHLDGCRDDRHGWMTSLAAVGRFLRAKQQLDRTG